MIHLRKAFRITVLVATWLALAYYGLNQTTGELAALLVIFASVAIPSHWASAWPAPQDHWPQHSID